MNVIVDLRPEGGESSPRNRDEFKVPVQVELRGDGALFVWVGNSLRAPELTSLVISHPARPGTCSEGYPVTTVAIANGNMISMEAALGAAKRFSKRYNRPVLLSYPPEPLPSNNDEEVFRQLEAALRRCLDGRLEFKTDCAY